MRFVEIQPGKTFRNCHFSAIVNPGTGRKIFVTQLAITAAMTGVIWLVQLVVYPQFLRVPETEFEYYYARHATMVWPLVVPLMVSELGLALFSAWYFRHSHIRVAVYVASFFAVAVWITTFLVQVPLHRALEEAWSLESIHRLIDTNWIRTGMWSLRLGLLYWLTLSWGSKTRESV